MRAEPAHTRPSCPAAPGIHDPIVTCGLGPRIHGFFQYAGKQDVDGRVKPGHDGQTNVTPGLDAGRGVAADRHSAENNLNENHVGESQLKK